MTKAEFQAAMRATGARANCAQMHKLAQRFDYAFRESRDLHVAMAAVNEVVNEPITYQQFFSALRRRVGEG